MSLCALIHLRQAGWGRCKPEKGTQMNHCHFRVLAMLQLSSASAQCYVATCPHKAATISTCSRRASTRPYSYPADPTLCSEAASLAGSFTNRQRRFGGHAGHRKVFWKCQLLLLRQPPSDQSRGTNVPATVWHHTTGLHFRCRFSRTSAKASKAVFCQARRWAAYYFTIVSLRTTPAGVTLSSLPGLDCC